MSLDTISLNITEDQYANAGVVAPVSEDHYEATIYAIDFDTVKNGPNKGKPRIKFQFKIVEGQQTGDKHAGRKIYHDVNAFTGVGKDGKPTPPFELLDIAKALGLGLAEVNSFNKGDWLGGRLFFTVNHEQKMTKESGYKLPFNPPEFRSVAKRFRSTDAAATSAAANAGTASTGGAKKSKYAL